MKRKEEMQDWEEKPDEQRGERKDMGLLSERENGSFIRNRKKPGES